jgi:hypothetical protein
MLLQGIIRKITLGGPDSKQLVFGLLNLFKKVYVSPPECINLVFSKEPVNVISHIYGQAFTDGDSRLFFFRRS